MSANDPASACNTIPKGTVPLVSVEGTAYECGCSYAQIVMERHPGYRRYLDAAFEWQQSPAHVRGLLERRAPYLIDVYRGLVDTAGPPSTPRPPADVTGCTSFGVSGSVTANGRPLSGQTKDTPAESALRYIVLRMRIHDAPTILVLAYPGEILGYGLWSTGMSLFRNTLYSKADAPDGLTMVQWGLLALAGTSVQEAVELAERFGIAGSGNYLICDAQGQSLSVEFSAGGVGLVPARNGIATHANHPEGRETAPFEDYPGEVEKEHSRLRMETLWKLLDAERGRLTAPKAMAALADHTHHPRGICCHVIDDVPRGGTTAAVVAEPALGKLHVVRGQPCRNRPVTYTI